MADMNNTFDTAAHTKMTVEGTRKLAKLLHKNQTDHSGHPYILHPARVVENLLKNRP